MAAARIVVETAAGKLAESAGEVVFGGRTGCTVVLDDPVAAARHCAFAHDGAAFVVRDLGSVSGTWVDGVRAAGAAALRDGGQVVFGASRVLVKIADVDGAPTLTLTLQRNGFWWTKAGKGVFDNDPDALVRSEVGFGRFPALKLGNRAALIGAAALLVASALLSAVLEPLSDPGPLLRAHAVATGVVAAPSADDGAHARLRECRALADTQGCTVCHEPGAGVTEAKCRQCHGDLAAPATRRHPYLGDGGVPQESCVECHTDHQGEIEDGLKPGAGAKTGKCELCHGEADVRARAATLTIPVAPARSVATAAYHFPHKAHAAIACADCHQVDPARLAARAAGLPDDPLGRDFAAIPYETCRSCHVAGSAAVGITADVQQKHRPTDDALWSVKWHGTEDGGLMCARCHAAGDAPGRFGPAARTVPRPLQTASEQADQRARYRAPARLHGEQFETHGGGKACAECHKDGNVTPRDPREARVFWHALHLAPTAMAAASTAAGAISSDEQTGCKSCHQGLWAAVALTDARSAAYHWPQSPAEAGACRTCHVERGAALAMTAAVTTAPGTVAEAPDFPHDVHLAAKGFGVDGSLAAGCYACHVFEAAGDGAHRLVPRTLPGAADCSSCHTGHANIGGGQCQECHPDAATRTTNSFLVSAGVPDGVVLRRRAPTNAAMRPWPGANGFSHLSRGHDVRALEGRQGVACSECHDVAATNAANEVGEVPIPREEQVERACRTCHLQQQFHWR
jgi:hypothetical protein